MAALVHKRASARRDLVEHFVYLAEHAKSCPFSSARKAVVSVFMEKTIR